MIRIAIKTSKTAILAGAFLFAYMASSHDAKAASNNIATGMGHDLAERLCSSCHLVEPDPRPSPGHVGGPAFQTVANRQDVSQETLRDHLRMTHSNAMIPLAMPNPQLTEDQLVKIISYILSLRNH